MTTTTKKLAIRDRPGCLPEATMRAYFEGAIQQTPAFASNTPLGTVEINGQFSHYVNAGTDIMWLGFALGMRCAERVEKARALGDMPLLREALEALESYACWAASMDTEMRAASAIQALKQRLAPVQTPGLEELQA